MLSREGKFRFLLFCPSTITSEVAFLTTLKTYHIFLGLFVVAVVVIVAFLLVAVVAAAVFLGFLWSSAFVRVMPILPTVATCNVAAAPVGVMTFLVAFLARWSKVTFIQSVIVLLAPRTKKVVPIRVRRLLVAFVPEAFRLTSSGNHFQGILRKKQKIYDKISVKTIYKHSHQYGSIIPAAIEEFGVQSVFPVRGGKYCENNFCKYSEYS